ncbi:glycosyltransferase family 39 protein [Paraburkholderia sp. IMGN_8]|uniref:glycosyltransferase family 39 protein n=1 Tax=Paraburkholderia sp. IMGN_8 TaxID=3136564 RepID=UPI0031018688
MESLKTGAAARYRSPDGLPGSLKQGDAAFARTLFLPLVVAIFAAAVFLRVFHLDYLSLWGDEIFSRYYYDLFGPAYLVTGGITVEPTPPLYYFMLETWMKMFGHSAIALRSLSVVASLIALPLVYAVARELSTRAVALVAMAFFAISPMAVYFSQEARVYMMTVILASLMLLGIARYLRRAHKTDLVMYGIAAVIALYSHATMLFLVAGCNVVVLGYLLLTPSTERSAATRNWLLVNAVVGLLGVPLFLAMLSIGKHGTGLSWIAPLALRDVLATTTGLILGPVTPFRMPGVELAGLSVIVVGAAIGMAGMSRRALAVVIGIPAVFFALVVITSLRQPILLTRILCWMTVPLCMLLAYAVVVPSRARIAARIMMTLMFAVGLYYQIAQADGAKPPYHEVLWEARTSFQQADEVVNAPYTSPLLLTYYLPDLPNVRKWNDPSVSGIEANELVDRLHIPRMSERQLRDDIKSGKAVWLLASSPDEKFLSQLFTSVPTPSGRYVAMCNAVAHHGVTPPPCIAAYGWNLHPRSEK